MTQLKLDLGNPFDPGDLKGRVSKGARILSNPRFDWETGLWNALCDVDGYLCIAAFNIYKIEEDDHVGQGAGEP